MENRMRMNLKLARISKGLTQKELASKIGKSHALINRMETGTTNLRVGELIKICEVLEIDISKVLTQDLFKLEE